MFPVVIQAVVDEGDGEQPFLIRLPSGLWALLTSVSREEFILEVMKDAGSDHLAHLGPWGSIPELSVLGLGCGVTSSAPSPNSGVASCLAPTAVTAAGQASGSGIHTERDDQREGTEQGGPMLWAVCTSGHADWLADRPPLLLLVLLGLSLATTVGCGPPA